MNMFKVLLVVLMLSSLAAPAMAADPIEALKEGVSGGIQDFFVSAADSVYSWGDGYGLNDTAETDQIKEEYGAGPAAVFKIAAHDYNPYESEAVQKMRLRTAVIGVFIFVIYVFYGASCVNLSCSGMGWIEKAQYVVSETPFDEYRKILIRALASILLVHYAFKLILKINIALVYQIMYSVLDSIQLSPDHWIMYCMLAICYGAELIFYAIRFLVMNLLAGSDILIGSLYSFKTTREFSIESVKYFCKVTFLQFIIVLLTSWGTAIIDEAPIWAQHSGYFALMVVLVVISAIIIFGFTRMFKTAKAVTFKRRF